MIQTPVLPVPRPPLTRRRADGVMFWPVSPDPLAAAGATAVAWIDLSVSNGHLVYCCALVGPDAATGSGTPRMWAGAISVDQCSRFWRIVLAGTAPGVPVHVRCRTRAAFDAITLLRAFQDAPDQLSDTGWNRMDASIPSLSVQRILQRKRTRFGVQAADLPDLRGGAAQHRNGAIPATSDTQLLLGRLANLRPDATVLHAEPRKCVPRTTLVCADGSALHGSRHGGAAAVAPDGSWIAYGAPALWRPATAEIAALTLACILIGHRRHDKEVTITSDSLHALAAARQIQESPGRASSLAPAKSDRRHYVRLGHALTLLAGAGVSVRFRWVKGHDGDPGNEVADRMARSVARSTLAGVPAHELPDRLALVHRMAVEDAGLLAG